MECLVPRMLCSLLFVCLGARFFCEHPSCLYDLELVLLLTEWTQGIEIGTAGLKSRSYFREFQLDAPYEMNQVPNPWSLKLVMCLRYLHVLGNRSTGVKQLVESSETIKYQIVFLELYVIITENQQTLKS